MNEILLRIKKIVTKTGLSDSAFAKSIDIPQTTFSNLLNRDSEPKADVLKSIIKKYNISANWLLTGEGEMFADAMSLPKRQENSTTVEIPLLKQTVSCGPGISWESEVNIEKRLYTTELFSPSQSAKNLFAFKAHGISMVGAGIHDGDLLIFDGSPSQETGDDIYIFSYSGDVFCKLLRFEPIESKIKIYSVQKEDLREAELVREIPADNEDFHIFGRVLGWIHENTVVRR